MGNLAKAICGGNWEQEDNTPSFELHKARVIASMENKAEENAKFLALDLRSIRKQGVDIDLSLDGSSDSCLSYYTVNVSFTRKGEEYPEYYYLYVPDRTNGQFEIPSGLSLSRISHSMSHDDQEEKALEYLRGLYPKLEKDIT